MTTLTSDLATVPWISPAYFAHHYPEHHARGAIYYLGFTLVHPDHQGAHVFHAMIEPMARLVIGQQGRRRLGHVHGQRRARPRRQRRSPARAASPTSPSCRSTSRPTTPPPSTDLGKPAHWRQ